MSSRFWQICSLPLPNLAAGWQSSSLRSLLCLNSISLDYNGCCILEPNGSEEAYDGCIIATHAPDALRILGRDGTAEEKRVLGAFEYMYNDIHLHHDKSFMPQYPLAWSAWNFLGTIDQKVCLTYWLNALQNIDATDQPPFLVTLNPHHTQKALCSNGQQAIRFHPLLPLKPQLSLTEYKGKEGFGFVVYIKDTVFMRMDSRLGWLPQIIFLGRFAVP